MPTCASALPRRPHEIGWTLSWVQLSDGKSCRKHLKVCLRLEPILLGIVPPDFVHIIAAPERIEVEQGDLDNEGEDATLTSPLKKCAL